MKSASHDWLFPDPPWISETGSDLKIAPEGCVRNKAHIGDLISYLRELKLYVD